MKNTTTLALTTLLVGSISLNVTAAQDWKDDAKDAWLDGKAETTLLLNTNLNSFDIMTDVKNGHVTLTGKVESSVDKALAAELIKSLDGVKGVENKLTVMNENESTSEVVKTLTDSKVATVVKTRLLFSTDVSGTQINVDVADGVVTLQGEVASDAERQLALTIAKNTDDVKKVVDKIKVKTS
ncbi:MULTISPECIES: BON domain-containing protein [Shewanella]|jgi:osmotically-inducible protein OsmY|uniref:BON domain-containing protein n=1 Tax=Shewanella xiamenensis TaxID=332186 RepID=A0AAE4TMA9_9GAMM|nr:MULTISPECIES: BON domain-containing protein [Shewanella]PZP31860.1 MAG: BON domain-containing protein [Shewanella oneidensis]ASF14988.1 BON domain-containing protein [Shewanella sp. FDAARGOS_354]KPN78625.1 transporter [Shewanella sp. Sh95]MBW0297352.1 transporter [Shewanella xiamenensis]MCD8548980.1 BON domain-containing protein [Shewanella xiamenensis]